MLRAKYNIDRSQVEKMNMTISLTMTVEEWLKIMRTTPKEIEPHSPFWHLQNMISQAMHDVTAATENNYSVDQWLKKEIK